MRHVVIILALASALPVPARVLAKAALSKRVQVEGVTLEYADWGGRGLPLVLVPGGCDTAFVFGDLTPQLTADFRVMSLTPRGCPGSDFAPGGYSIDQQLRELAGFLDSQGIQRAVLAGHSSGGGKITRFARLYPARVEGLVYFDTVYSFVAPGLEAGMDAAIAKRLASIPDGSLERFRATAQAWELGVWSPALERNAALTLTHEVPEDWRAAVRADLEAGRYFETTVRVPALMFFALELDTARLRQFDAATQAALTPLVRETEAKRREQIEAFRRNGPHIRIVEWKDTSHYCFAQKPAPIAEEIRAFFRQRR